MRDARLPPATLEGWYMLHEFFRLDWAAIRANGEGVARKGREFADLLASWEDLGDGGWSAAYRLAGGGSDVMLLHLRERLDDLTEAERSVQRSALGPLLWRGSDYVSVVELGLYGLTRQVAGRFEDEEPDEETWSGALQEALDRQLDVPYVRDRLYPRQPEDKPYVSFYPMSKRRAPEQNWYRLPLSRREELMQEHGAVGRRYAGRISQVISGSVGLDDWEWAVTLFAADPLDFKAVVTEMRYDEASAKYADFGPFFVGRRMPAEDWTDPDRW